jgi:hypothetical protein
MCSLDDLKNPANRSEINRNNLVMGPQIAGSASSCRTHPVSLSIAQPVQRRHRPVPRRPGTAITGSEFRAALIARFGWVGEGESA